MENNTSLNLTADTINLENVLIDNRQFKCMFRIFSPDGYSAIIKKSAIINFDLECTLLDWYTQGSLTFDNTFDIIERATPVGEDRGEYRKHTGYIFRGDGRDLLQIILFPEITPDAIEGDLTAENYRRSMYLEYIFSIYNIIDSPDSASNTKYKTIYFHEAEYQFMKEKRIFYSTAYTAARTQGKDITQLSNVDRGIPTSQALREIITRSNDFTSESELFDDENWDTGGSSIMYSSPVNSSAHDNMMYLYGLHTSTTENNFDRCIITRDRYTKKWQLIPIRQIFKEGYDRDKKLPGKRLFEKIILQGVPGQEDSIVSPAPKSPKETITLPDLSYTSNYSFVPLNDVFDRDIITNRFIHSYHQTEGTFNIFIEQNTFTKAVNEIQSEYMNNMFGKNPTVAIPSTKIKKQLQTAIHTYSIYNTEQTSLTSGRNQNIYAGLFLNQAIWFNVRGSTHRQAGQFIAIDRDDNYDENTFDKRLLGIYLIVSVRHIMVEDEYFNNIIAVKPYYYEDLQLTEDSI